MDGWMDGWMDGQTDRQINKRIDGEFRLAPNMFEIISAIGENEQNEKWTKWKMNKMENEQTFPIHFLR